MESGKKRLWITLLISMLIFSSCAPSYVPNATNAPLLSEKGELQMTTWVGTAGFDPQVAYAVGDHMGLMLNGSFASRDSDSTNNFHRHRFIEAGIGYFTKIGNLGRFEAYGGYGFGDLQANFENSLWTSSTNVTNNRIFIQPTVGISTDVFEAGFTPRLVWVSLDQAGNSSSGVFIEPVEPLNSDLKTLKLLLSLGFHTQ